MTDRNHPLLQKLNEAQIQAVTAGPGPYLILAGPGSGKTRVLTHRIAWMLTEQHIPAWQILAVTFTNKAAKEMRHRLERMVGEQAAHEMAMGTFHSVCVRLLRREAATVGLNKDFLILDTDDQLSVMKQIVKEMGLDDKKYRPPAILNAISNAKNELIPPTQYPVKTYYDEIVARAYARYQETLRKNSGVDFDDLLTETVRLLRDNPETLERYRDRYHYLLVDEFQDTNMAQYLILKLLAEKHRSLYAVADEDQSIYSWRGADYRNIQRLHQDFPEIKKVLLEENYRSTQPVLDVAQAIISRNKDRTPKQLFTKKAGGTPVTLHECYDENDEAAYIAREIQAQRRGGRKYSDIAVMYRTNAQSRALEELFIKENLPYRLIGGTRFYSRKEIKDLLAFLRLAQNPDDDVSFLRVVNVPTRGIGQRTLATVSEQAAISRTSQYQTACDLIDRNAVDARTKRALAPFLEMIQNWHAQIGQEDTLHILDRILKDTGFGTYINDGTEDGASRWENVLELRAVAAGSPGVSLTDFLTEVALVADVDQIDENVDAVTLLTLHSAKGLEYPVVFLSGLEEGLLPHSRSIESPEQLAEERRLLYVGITRAMETLFLTYAFRRGWYGSNEPAMPSRFIKDLPETVVGRRRQPTTTAPGSTWSTPSWKSSSGQARPSLPTVQARFRSGQRVRHREFGEGLVLESEIQGRDELVTVRFAGGIGTKRLLAGVAPLEPLPDH